MKSVIKYLEKLIKKRTTIIFFLLGLIVSFLVCISMANVPLQVEEQYSDYAYLCEGYAAVFVDKSEDGIEIRNALYGLNKIEFKSIDITPFINFDLPKEYKVTAVGVEFGFEKYPIPYFDKHVLTFEKNKISSGETFDENDYFLSSNVAIMENIHLQMLGYKDDCIMINDSKFVVKGALDSSYYSIRNRDGQSTNIPIYIPMSTFEILFGKKEGMSIYIYDIKDYSFKELEQYYQFVSKEKIVNIMNNEISKRNQNSFIIVFSLFFLSIASTFIMQYVILRNKHYEIGIKRALGASRIEVIYEYMVDFTLTMLISLIIGTLVGIDGVLVFYYPRAIAKCFTLDISNIYWIIVCIVGYYCISLIFEIFSLILGTKINIASTITEER